MSGQALSGLKVVEWSDFVSGPYCGKLLADLGAEVVKVESPGLGDKARSYGPFPQDIPHPERSGLFLYLNTNKLGVTLDVRTATGAQVLSKLVEQADVLVENNPPRQVEELGFAYKRLSKVNPRLVMTSITPFGQTGPYRDYRSCDLISFNASGLAFVNPSDGVEDPEGQPPLKGPGHQGDFVAGLSGAVATMAAVINSGVTGSGQHVDVSEQEALASIMRSYLGLHAIESMTWTRLKGSIPGMVSDKYHCADGMVYLLCGQDRFWAQWMKALGDPDWAQNELFQDRISRRENWDAAKAMIEEWTRERTVEEVVRTADASRVPCRPINTVKDLANSELAAARDYFVDVDHKEAGTVKYPVGPFKLSQTPWRVQRPAPLLGEHNEEVYCNRLGYTRQELTVMRAGGVI